MTVESWLGEDDYPALLNLANARNEADLIAVCSVYASMAKAANAYRMACLQSAIEKVLSDQGWDMGSPCHHLHPSHVCQFHQHEVASSRT